jgi:serine/threonine-protein phosphatase PGAM5
MPLLYLVRHAEPEPSADEDPQVGLSPLGRRQARLLGQRLRDVPLDGIHHSPLTRARQTALLIAESRPGTPVHSSELLTDRTPVPAPGREADYPARVLAWFDTVPEQERDLGGTRIAQALAHFAALPDDAHHLLVTHAFVVGWFVRQALDAPAWRWMGLNPFNAALTVIRCLPDRSPTLVSFNDVGHLPMDARGHTPLDLLS